MKTRSRKGKLPTKKVRRLNPKKMMPKFKIINQIKRIKLNQIKIRRIKMFKRMMRKRP